MMQGTRHPGERYGAASRPQQDGRERTGQDQDPRPPSTYNFVPLSAFVHLPAWAEEVSHDVPFEDGYCGEIEYTLTAQTPILVAGVNEQNQPKVFATRPDAQGKPRAIIPGSSVRGMLRNVLEIASFGKFQRVGNRALSLRDISPGGHMRGLYGERLTETVAPGVYRARSRGGWLRFEGGQWLLRPCEIARVDHSVIADVLQGNDFRPTRIGRNGKPTSEALTAKQAYGRWLRPGESAEALAVKFTIKGEVGQAWDHSGGKSLQYTRVKELKPPTDPSDCERGMLVFTGSVGRKHMEFVFYLPRGEPERADIEVPPEVSAAFLQVHTKKQEGRQQDGAAAPNESLAAVREIFARHPLGIPVFYLAEGDEPTGRPAAIGLSQMFRLAYEKTIHEAIGSVNRAHLGEQPDLGELIFGRVSARAPKQPCTAKVDRALRGRVTIETLHELPGDGGRYAEPIRCDATILGSPRPSFFPYYMHQPLAGKLPRLARGSEIGGRNVSVPNGDAVPYSSLSSQPVAGGARESATLTLPASSPRGWKRYPMRAAERGNGRDPVPQWQREFEREARPKDSVMAKLEPLPASTRFRGRIRFHNLRTVELSALLWTMTWGGQEKYWHSLGMGKPFGWGGCRIEVTGLRARRNDAATDEFVDLTVQLEPHGELLQAFVQHMEQVYGEWNGHDVEESPATPATWAGSEQVLELLAMADPGNAEQAPQQLRNPWMLPGRDGNEFARIKEYGQVLPRYGGHWAEPGSREGRERARRDAVRGLSKDGC